MMTHGGGRRWRSDTRPLRCHSPEACCTPPGAFPRSRRRPSSRLRLHPPPPRPRRPGPAACWTAAAWRCGSRSPHLHHWESPLPIRKITQPDQQFHNASSLWPYRFDRYSDYLYFPSTVCSDKLHICLFVMLCIDNLKILIHFLFFQATLVTYVWIWYSYKALFYRLWRTGIEAAL